MLLENKTAIVYGGGGAMGGVGVVRVDDGDRHAGPMTAAVLNLSCGAIAD